MSEKKILILCQYFYPEYVPFVICTNLIKNLI